jgi:hypothetical protein
MRVRPLLFVLAAGTLAPTAGGAPPLRLADLPGVEALRPIPPLAPPQPPATEVPRLRGTVSVQERVVVEITPQGAARNIEVEQRLRLRSLGDYTFFIPAPAIAVVTARGSESQPGFRPNQIVWQGFSPRRKVLAARARLRLAESVSALPLRVRMAGAPVRPGPFELALTIENTTGTPAAAFTADVVRADVVRALAALRAAARRNRPIEGRVVRIRGQENPVRLYIRAPLALSGAVRFPAGSVRALAPARFRRRLEGGALRLTVRGVALRAAVPRLKLVARPLVRAALPPRSARTFEAVLLGYLRYARARQYQAFLANPDPRGPSVTEYVYETSAAVRRPVEQPPPGDDSALPTALVAVGLTLLGLGLVVVWAHL